VLRSDPHQGSYRFLLVVLFFLTARTLLAAEQASVDSAAATEQLKAALRDQTIIQSSAWLDTEWDQFNGGAKELTWTLGILWGWAPARPARFGFAFQAANCLSEE